MDLSWKSMLAMPQPLLSFVLRATYDTLPSPSNLHRWHIPTNVSCFLCDKSICTSAHILSGCKKALDQGRYTFRHDSVLCEIASALSSFLSSYVVMGKDCKKVSFFKAGTHIKKSMKKPRAGLLNIAADWKVLVDFNDKLVIPVDIAVSQLRPDIFIFSRTKTLHHH